MSTSWSIVATILVCASAQAGTTTYAIAVGNNAPPPGDRSLPVLHYADDDAVRYYEFFGRFADEASLLTVLDAPTQKRYPKLAAVAQAPTLETLRRVVRQLSGRVQQDVRRGDRPVVYFAFSGHGAQLPDGTPYLALADGELTRTLLQEEILKPLSDALMHVFVDACYAESVVGPRGLFDKEVNGRVTDLSEGDAEKLAQSAGLRFPRVGTLVAATAGQQSHEWSQIESGVFTHELLSGLAGAADVDGDGLVDYGEIQAFLVAANRDVRDPRARPTVVAHPPAANPGIPIVTLGALRDVAFLVGDFSRLGHFYVELDDGERCLEANLSSDVKGRIAVPANRQAYVVARDLEASLSLRSGEMRTVGSLALRSRDIAARGSVEASLREWLFASPFGPSYHRGFRDALSLAPAASAPGALAQAPVSGRKPLAVATWTVSALALIGAATSTGLALRARDDYRAASMQRTASDARDRYTRYRAGAVVAGAGAVAGGIAGWFLWPVSERDTKTALVPGLAGITVWRAW